MGILYLFYKILRLQGINQNQEQLTMLNYRLLGSELLLQGLKMIYNDWYEEHAKKHAAIMKKLEGLDEYDVVQYFIFENMVEKEPDFCELYATKTKCHEMYELNCYMCGCPHFRFYQSPPLQDDLEFHSVCSINSKRGKRTFTEEQQVHQDCSGCTIPHGEDYILSNFDRDWLKMMEKVKN